MKNATIQCLKSFAITLLFLLIYLSLSAHAENVNMLTIAQIESSNNSMAYNKHTQARGLYQITPICLADYNLHPSHRNKEQIIIEEKLFDEKINYQVANWYMNKRIPELLKYYGKDDTLENRLISYNCGISCVGKKLPKETIDYINKYKNLNKQ